MEASSREAEGRKNLVEEVKDEYGKNVAFRMTCIGGVLLLISSILGAFVHPLAGLVNSLFMAAYVALIMYGNYCYVNGKCNTFAKINGALSIVMGVLSVILSILTILLYRKSQAQTASLLSKMDQILGPGSSKSGRAR
jgi:uncharacterized membrane protein